MQIQELILLYKLELERTERGEVIPLGQTLGEYKAQLNKEIKELKKLDARVRTVVEG